MHEIFGEYHHLLPELRSGDHEFCFRYLRMSPERSDHLLSLVKDKFIKENTRFRKSILPEERSLLTLKFHVTGMSQQRLSFLFTIDKSTVGKFLQKLARQFMIPWKVHIDEHWLPLIICYVFQDSLKIHGIFRIWLKHITLMESTLELNVLNSKGASTRIISEPLLQLQGFFL